MLRLRARPAAADPGLDCGHETLDHGAHVDYVHGAHRHAAHGDHYDEH
ncbi:MAG: hypothetical protein KG028_09095 [Actinobacteria bacterium]|jgi:hypothetical protein|nr:hypothetical protein [Actinomycetota bacterium]